MSDNDPQSNHASRLAELEMALAYQQRLCEQLNEIVTAHSQELLGLKRLVAELQGRIKELREQRKEPQSQPHDEKPPHY
ncbi:MAG: SlyX family protein [Pirellulaceae bacterium]|nr:SlyX family protein [Pirellulaceae bacterium]